VYLYISQVETGLPVLSNLSLPAPPDVLVKFERPSYEVPAAAENFAACVLVDGQLGTNISISVTMENRTVRGKQECSSRLAELRIFN